MGIILESSDWGGALEGEGTILAISCDYCFPGISMLEVALRVSSAKWLFNGGKLGHIFIGDFGVEKEGRVGDNPSRRQFKSSRDFLGIWNSAETEILLGG